METLQENCDEVSKPLKKRKIESEGDADPIGKESVEEEKLVSSQFVESISVAEEGEHLEDLASGDVPLEIEDEDLEHEDVPSDTDGESRDEIEDEKSASDPFKLHFEHELPETSETVAPVSYVKHEYKWPEFGEVIYNQPSRDNAVPQPSLQNKNLNDFHLKDNLLKSCQDVKLCATRNKLSLLQLEFFNAISNYFDLLFMNRTHENGEKLRLVYTLHVLNHILKSRAKIVHHNSKLSKNPNEEFRDQGFTRPVALILVPFRNDCHLIVKHLSSLLPGCVVMNRKRFENEYGPQPAPPRLKKKPQDYDETFAGNTDEDFKIGLRIKNKSMHLYSEFYSSDLIIASPLGIRQIIGAEGEKGRDFDFLSSVEILLIDRADILLLQNQRHLQHVLQHMNLLPKETHDCNFFRVRMYALDGMAKFYRQTILLSSVEHSWFEAVIFRTLCFNYAGYLATWTDVKTPAIRQVLVRLKMCFRWFEASNPEDEIDSRFNFFVSKVLPDYKDPTMAQTLIYIPSYFDFVRLRNYFRQTELSCVMVCEYSKKGKVAQARDVFFKGHRHFMLYTERSHFYSRYHIKGIQHVIFYQLPTYPRYFSEICNALFDCNPRRKLEEKSCSVLACKMDLLQLKHIVGMKEAKHMHNSKKVVFINYVGQ